MRTTAYQGKVKGKEYEFWNAMYMMLLKVYWSSFSAVTACIFNWSMIDLLRKKDESLECAAPAFKGGSSQWKV